MKLITALRDSEGRILVDSGDYISWANEDGKEFSGVVKEIVAVVELPDKNETALTL